MHYNVSFVNFFADFIVCVCMFVCAHICRQPQLLLKKYVIAYTNDYKSVNFQVFQKKWKPQLAIRVFVKKRTTKKSTTLLWTQNQNSLYYYNSNTILIFQHMRFCYWNYLYVLSLLTCEFPLLATMLANHTVQKSNGL